MKDYKKFYGDSEYKGLSLFGEIFILPFKVIAAAYKKAYTTKREWRLRDILLDAMSLIWYIFIGSVVLVYLDLKGVFIDIFIGIFAIYLGNVLVLCLLWILDSLIIDIFGIRQRT